jgi:integrase
VPIPAVLRDYLDEAVIDLEPGDLVMSRRTRTRPFCSSRLMQRARKGWEAAALEALTLHEARHTFASLMIAAGVNAKALSTFMGHHSIVITLDLYGHLMPGSEEEAAALLDSYLLRSREQGRAAGQTRDSDTPSVAVLSGSER